MSAPADPTPSDPASSRARRIAVVSGGLGEVSRTRVLAERLAAATAGGLAEHGIAPRIRVISLRELAVDVAQALVSGLASPSLREALDEVEGADAVIAVAPTFKASYAGIFKSFWDLVEDDAVRGIPVLLGATGGNARHSLMIDTVMRPLFAYFRMRVVPMAVFAASADWGEDDAADPAHRTDPLHVRVRTAGAELADLMALRPPRGRTAAEEPEAAPEVTPL